MANGVQYFVEKGESSALGIVLIRDFLGNFWKSISSSAFIQRQMLPKFQDFANYGGISKTISAMITIDFKPSVVTTPKI